MRPATVLQILVLGAVAAVIPAPQGLFAVSWEELELVDANRLDPYNPSHARRIMISHFTPVTKCKEICKIPYMPFEVARVEDDILGEYLRDIGWQDGLLENLEIETCCQADSSAPTSKRFPTVLLDTGLNTTRYFYTATAQHLASAGYNVILMDHPYETDVVLFPNGEIIFGGRVDTTNLTSIEFGVEVRSQDVSFILGTFGVKKTVYVGHSFGGAAAASSMMQDSRIAGGVNLDGALWGPVQDLGVSRPFLTFGSSGHNSSTEDSWARFFNATETYFPATWQKELNIRDTVHGSFCDFPLAGKATGLNENELLLDFFFGRIDADRMIRILVAYLDAFIRFTLRCGKEGLLAGENEDYPEVSFLQ
ncbi:putative 1-alkyl-2-acetylglycerophosphocholine esterase [Paramyrothecium foliicola]|nr:putative 1-alkyl-2-acetylglycerophosphocholine esterase [Paramyrothecium foliicola]